MLPTFFRYIFLSVLLTVSLLTRAGIPMVTENSESTFDEKKVRKGIYLSEIFSQPFKGKKDIKIKLSGAMRFDATYAPTDGTRPIDLPISEIQKHVDRAHNVLKLVKESNAYTTLLEGKDIKLPIGIKRQVGTKEITICLDSIIITPSYAYGVLYVVIEDTRNDKTLAFWGKDIRFTKDGGFTGDARLELLQTYDLNFGTKSKISFLVDQTHENYVVFNCDGFKHLHVDAKIFFSRSIFVPEIADGILAPDPAQVTAEFETDFQSFDEWLVQVSNIPKFQVVGLEGMSFQLGTMALDYSSTQNPTSMIFPTGYDHPALLSGDPTLWEGFFVKDLVVTLPKEFKLKSNASQRISLTLHNGIIDKLGFSGIGSIQNLIPMSEGDMSGWAYSLDMISIEVLKNSVRSAEFLGKINIPIAKETENFSYHALIQAQHNYSLTVTVDSKISFPLWGAGQVNIKPDSWVNVTYAHDKFSPQASLNGDMSIGAGINKEGESQTSNESNKLTLLEVGFEKLRISSGKPHIYIDPNGGSFGLGSPGGKQKAAKLPITLDFVYLKTKDSIFVGVDFEVSLNLLGSKDTDKGSSISAEFTVWGKEKAGTRLGYQFHKVEFNCVRINNLEIAVIKLNGNLCFFRDDVTYGSGFAGSLDFKIDLGKRELALYAAVIFGKKDDPTDEEGIFRYFAIDVLMETPVAIPIFPGILYMNAFGGGASMRMKVADNVASPYFVSKSGLTYVPDSNTGLGVRAMLGVQGQTKEAYEGQLIFEIVFRKGGGLRMIAFSGYVQVASFGKNTGVGKLAEKLKGFKEKCKNVPAASSIYETDNASQGDIYGEIQRMADGGAMLAQWKMVYDRDNHCFKANLDLFVDIFDVIKGVNPIGNSNAHAGRIDILFQGKGGDTEKDNDWHVFVGVPQYPMGVNIIGLVDITAYLMVGKNLYPPLRMPFPDAPYPSFPTSTDGTASIGKGFGTGARLHVSVGKPDATFYYYFGADAGFDVLFWNVNGEKCNGKVKGIKGWYGAGQVFVYLVGSAGLKTCVNVPYPCGCRSCHSCDRRCWRPWCWGCDWCHDNVCVNVGATIDFGIYGIIEGIKPTYIEGGFLILGMRVPVKIGHRC